MGFEEIHIGLYWKPVIDFYKINKLTKSKNRFPIKSILFNKEKNRIKITIKKYSWRAVFIKAAEMANFEKSFLRNLR
jgi:hypothetical protein